MRVSNDNACGTKLDQCQGGVEEAGSAHMLYHALFFAWNVAAYPQGCHTV